ncbi:ribonuclease P protein subunit p30 [Contarinia nasturtii]|uniref:ribonuclease P protein subunit p30 n=1 Tax=Contarinia nasturtii TaxID=265458 RepID=UPI0012D4984A|nr:ribonuclease P protein subunit p30 [Contarinia nasturtii]
MEITKGFYDLSVPYQSNESDLFAILNELYNVGYRTVAIDETFDHTKCNRKVSDIFPAPADLTSLRAKFENKLKILNRLSIVFTQNVVMHDMNLSTNIKKYNLICGIPINETAMHYACSTFPGDMIGMLHDEATKVFLIGHKYYQMAARRGIYFEVPYAPAIRNSNHRKDVIVIAQNIVSHRKPKSIVITGGALNPFQVRSPYDVANLGLIFGLSEEQSKSAISNICRTILLKAEGRRYGKTVIFAKNTNEPSDEDGNDSESDEEESNSDESMDEGHPPKKLKFS